MPCIACRSWCHHFKWHSAWSSDGSPEQLSLPGVATPGVTVYQDSSDPRVWWYIQCAPTCRANQAFSDLEDFRAHMNTMCDEMEQKLHHLCSDLTQSWTSPGTGQGEACVGWHSRSPPSAAFAPSGATADAWWSPPSAPQPSRVREPPRGPPQGAAAVAELQDRTLGLRSLMEAVAAADMAAGAAPAPPWA